METKFTSYRHSNFLVIEITAEKFDFSEISQSSDAIRDICRRAGYPHIIFDLRGVKLIDSSGIGFLIEIRNMAKKNERQLAVINNDRKVLQILKMMHVSQMLWVVPDMKEAEARFFKTQSADKE